MKTFHVSRIFTQTDNISHGLYKILDQMVSFVRPMDFQGFYETRDYTRPDYKLNIFTKFEEAYIQNRPYSDT